MSSKIQRAVSWADFFGSHIPWKPFYEHFIIQKKGKTDWESTAAVSGSLVFVCFLGRKRAVQR